MKASLVIVCLIIFSGCNKNDYTGGHCCPPDITENVMYKFHKQYTTAEITFGYPNAGDSLIDTHATMLVDDTTISYTWTHVSGWHSSDYYRHYFGMISSWPIVDDTIGVQLYIDSVLVDECEGIGATCSISY